MWSQGVVVDPNAPEVRWCSSCHHNAVVLVGRWQHTTGGSATGETTRDYRCQHCGKKYRIRPRLHTTLGMIVGVMAATTIIGLPIFFVYWRRHNVHKRIPPAAGAPMPPMRFFDGPPLRACGGCQTPATVQKVTRTSHNGIPTGTEYVYGCATCSREFTIQSAWGIVFGALMGLLVVAATAAFVAWAETPGWFWGGSIVCGLIALLLLGSTVAQIRARIRHRIVPMPMPMH
jgi:DNA-directed RNA polymerase subunit RPC12/RpoP